MKRIAPRMSRAVFACVLAGLLSSQVDISAQQLQLPPPSDGGLAFAEVVMQGGGRGFAGLATIFNGQPTIFYDATWLTWMGGVHTPAFRFLRAHEYAHHRRGHVLAQFNTPPVMLPILGYQSELDADCVAVRTLRAAQDQQAIQAGFAVYQRLLPPGDTPDGRPGGINRTQTMQACLQN
jgi:hypothetical protein